MNLELICCILYGLKYIYIKKNIKKDVNIQNSNSIGFEINNNSLISLNDNKDPEAK